MHTAFFRQLHSIRSLGAQMLPPAPSDEIAVDDNNTVIKSTLISLGELIVGTHLWHPILCPSCHLSGPVINFMIFAKHPHTLNKITGAGRLMECYVGLL